MSHQMMYAHPGPDRPDDEDQPTPPRGGPSVSGPQGIAIVAAVGTLVLMLADMWASESFVPVQMRILALGAVLGALQVYLNGETLKEVRAQKKGPEYIRGYVDGVQRRPPEPDPRG